MSRPRYLILACLIGALGLLAAPSFAAAAGDLTPNPTQLDFGTQGIHQGSTPSQSVKFENLTGADLSVSAVNIVGADAANFTSNNDCSFVVDGTSCDVSVAFNPRTPVPMSAQIELVDDNGTVIVPLSGTGAAGSLRVFAVLRTTALFLRWPAARRQYLQSLRVWRREHQCDHRRPRRGLLLRRLQRLSVRCESRAPATSG